MPPVVAHNLPAALSSFIGREAELRAVGDRLGETRLLTLTGPGGTGKTRLALEAAAAQVGRFPDGVWLVPLAGLATPELVVDSIANILTLPETADPQLEQLAAFLQDKQLLLVLDNCEHLLAECARVVARLLARCPHLALLATSREPLTLTGEVVLRVGALSLPDPTQPAERSSALRSDAVRLFVERAHAAEPLFQLSAGNTTTVIEICRRLDGIPLALELAAAQIRGLGVANLAARLDQRFSLLIGGDRAALPRQQTLYAAIDWSYRLLPASEQTVFRRLGIFAGDFPLEAAEHVSADADDVLAASLESVLHPLLRLVDKSLVQLNQETGRYRLLETIRAFALERLADVGDVETVAGRHLAWYLALAEDAAPHLSGREQAAWGARLEAEHDNLRAALAWALDAGRAGDAARLALALWRFWHTHTYQREGLRWLERILALDDAAALPVEQRPCLFNALGVLANSLLLFEQATTYQTEALRLWRERGDRLGMAWALCSLGWLKFDQMHQAQAAVYAAESLALARAAGDRPASAAALFLGALAAVEGSAGDMDPAARAELVDAIAALQEAMAIWRAAEDPGNMARAMSLLARAEAMRGNRARAGPLLRDAVRLLVQAGNYIDLQAALVALHLLALDAPRQPEGALLAAQVAGMMAARIDKLGASSPWNDGPFQQTIRQLAAMLGADAFTRAFELGKHMSPGELIALTDRIIVLVVQPAVAEPSLVTAPHANLTKRELEVLRLVAGGLTNAEVARRLHVTPRTINAHLTAIYSKLGVASRGGAMHYALEQGLWN